MKLAWRTNQQFWLSHNAVLYSWRSFSFFICNSLSERILTSCKKTLTTWAQRDKTLQETIAFPDNRKSLLVIQIQETLWRINVTTWNPLYSPKKNFAFQKKLKKMLLSWRVNLADQSKQQSQEIKMRVTYHTWPLSMKQTFDRHMSTLFD